HTRCYRDWSSDVCSSDLDLEVRLGDLLGGRLVSLHEGGRDFAAEAGAGGDQARLVLRQRFFIDPRLVVKPLPIGDGRQLEQVLEIGRASCRERGGVCEWV